MTREEAVLILDPDNSEAALARLEYYAGFGGEEAELRIIRDACRLAVKALRETGAWVSVEQQTPEEGRLVLVWCRSRMSTRHITVSTFYDGKWSRRVRDVTHWMPLPEPPDVPTEEN